MTQLLIGNPNTRSALQYFLPLSQAQDYCEQLKIGSGKLDRNGFNLACWLPFASKSREPQKQATTKKAELLGQGMETLASQVIQDLQVGDSQAVQQALLIVRNLLWGHKGKSKQLVIEVLNSRGIVGIIMDSMMFRSDELNILGCQCLQELLQDDEQIQEILDSGVLSRVVGSMSEASKVTSAILQVLLVLLQMKDYLLQVLIALERADAANVLLLLLTKMETASEALPVLQVLQLLLKRSFLAINQSLKSSGIELLSRWLANLRYQSHETDFQIGFEIIIDLLRKHQNMSPNTKLAVMQQMQRGGIINVMSVALLTKTQYRRPAIYALSQLCQIQGTTEVLAHMLQRDHYTLLVKFALEENIHDEECALRACTVLACLLESEEGFQVLRSLVLAQGLGCLVTHPRLGDIVINIGCSQGGLALLLGLSCGQDEEVLAAAEALAAIATFQPSRCAPVLVHGNLLFSLLFECLQQIKDTNNEEQKPSRNEVELRSSTVDIVQALMNTLPSVSFETSQRQVSKSRSSSFQDRMPSPSRLVDILQSQNSIVSAVSSLSQTSIPREEVNLKRYDSATFVIGGREVYALGWVMEQHSPFIQKQLSGLKNVKGERVSLPQVPGIPEEHLHELFQLAVEFAYTGTLASLNEEDILPLWALSSQLQMHKLQDYCEELITQEMIFENEKTFIQVVQWTTEGMQRNSGKNGKIWGLCIDGIVEHFDLLRSAGTLKQLAVKYIEQLTMGLAGYIRQRLLESGFFQQLSIKETNVEGQVYDSKVEEDSSSDTDSERSKMSKNGGTSQSSYQSLESTVVSNEERIVVSSERIVESNNENLHENSNMLREAEQETNADEQSSSGELVNGLKKN